MQMHQSGMSWLSIIVLIVLGLIVLRLLSRSSGARVAVFVLLCLVGVGFLLSMVIYSVRVRSTPVNVSQGSRVTVSPEGEALIAADGPSGAPATLPGAERPDGVASEEEDWPADGAGGMVDVSIAAKRPEWVDAEPGVTGHAYRLAVTAGPYKTLDQCQQELDGKLQEGVEQYAAKRLGPAAAAEIELNPEYVRRRLVKEQWQETIVSPTPSIGPMVQLHALMEFDRDAAGRIDGAWKEVLVRHRVRAGGIGLGALLLLLSVAYVYLKADLATQGVYRGRLRIAAAAMILGVVVAATLAAIS